MAKQRFKKGQRLREAHLRRLEDGNQRNAIRPSPGMLVSSGPSGTVLTPMIPDATTATGSSGPSWIVLTADNADGTYAFHYVAPVPGPTFWVDSLTGGPVAIEANLFAGLPIPSYVPSWRDAGGRPRFQAEDCSP